MELMGGIEEAHVDKYCYRKVIEKKQRFNLQRCFTRPISATLVEPIIAVESSLRTT